MACRGTALLFTFLLCASKSKLNVPVEVLGLNEVSTSRVTSYCLTLMYSGRHVDRHMCKFITEIRV
jgi:hypothetical protein